ncbi:MAG: hypothetical protein ACRDV4_10845 [Acidimicrobiales bacterium]
MPRAKPDPSKGAGRDPMAGNEMPFAGGRWTGDPIEVARRFIHEQRLREAEARPAPGWSFNSSTSTSEPVRQRGRHLRTAAPGKRYAVLGGVFVILVGAIVSLALVSGSPPHHYGLTSHEPDPPVPSRSANLPGDPKPDPAPGAQSATTTTSVPVSTTTTSTPKARQGASQLATTTHGDPRSSASGPSGNSADPPNSSPVLGAPSTAASSTCTPSDFSASASTDSATYSSSSVVDVSSGLVANTSCVMNPVASCPTAMTIDTASSSQVYPVPGQDEGCSPVPAGTVQAGSTLEVSFSWDQQESVPSGTGQAPPGNYTASVTWWWDAGGGGPAFELNARSVPFTIGQ